MNLHVALKSLCPDCVFIIHGNTYDDIEWFEENPQGKPTQEEVEAEVIRLERQSALNQYQRDRQQAYPSIADQLDILYHYGYEGWHAAISDVKQRFPKQ